MSMVKGKQVLAAAAFLLLCVSASAQQPPSGPPPEGMPEGAGPPQGGPPPSSPGVPAANPRTYEVAEFFAGVDADDDGGMTREEFKAVGLTDRFFTFCDPDGNDAIDAREMAECALPEAVDMNKDGALTVPEVVAFEQTAAGRERGPGEPVPE